MGEATKRVLRDAVAAARLPEDNRPLRDGGKGAKAYADAVTVYLGIAISRFADRNNSLCTWDSQTSLCRWNDELLLADPHVRRVSGICSHGKAIPMAWDYGEANVVRSDWPADPLVSINST